MKTKSTKFNQIFIIALILFSPCIDCLNENFKARIMSKKNNKIVNTSNEAKQTSCTEDLFNSEGECASYKLDQLNPFVSNDFKKYWGYLKPLLKQVGFGACKGDFKGRDLKNPGFTTPICNAIPLVDDANFHILSFQTKVVCPTMTKMAICVTFNNCGTFALAFTGGLPGCIASIAGGTTGPLAAVKEVATSVNSFSIGFSKDKQFQQSVEVLYVNGNDISSRAFTVKGHVFINLSMKLPLDALKMEKFDLNKVIQLSANVQFLVNFGNALNVVEKTIADLQSMSPETADNVIKNILGTNGEIVLNVDGTITYGLNKVSQGILPSFSFSLGKANIFFTTGKGDSGLESGLYLRVSSNAAKDLSNSIKGFLSSYKDVMKMIGFILDDIPNFGLELGLMITKSSIGVELKIGDMSIQCIFKYDPAKLSCGIGGNFFNALFEGAKAVFKAAAKFFDDTGKVIVEKSKQAFTEATQKISEGVNKAVGFISDKTGELVEIGSQKFKELEKDAEKALNEFNHKFNDTIDKIGKGVEMAAKEAEKFATEKAEMIARETKKAAIEAKAAVERAASETKEWFEKDAKLGAEKFKRDLECRLKLWEDVDGCIRRSQETYDRGMGRNVGGGNNEPPKPCPQNEFENTNWNDEGQGSVFYLDRHTLECGSNAFIGGFKLERWNGKIRYRYSCIESDADNLGDCYAANTELNDVIHWDDKHTANWLDRHDVKCKDGYGLKKYQMQRDGNRVRYAYKCCSGAKNCLDLQTPTEDSGTHETVYLDRLIVDAGSNRILSGFKLENLPDNKWKYNYRSCQIPGNLKVKSDTGCQDAADGSIWFLDRHKIKCKENNAIARFKLIRPSETQKDSIKYDYTCINSLDISNDCSNHETPRNDFSGDERNSIMWLDRHNLKCENGKVMNSFEFARDADKIFYKYTCCKANVVSVQTVETQFKPSHEGRTYYLDRYDVAAEGWNVISGFVFKTEGGNWRYQVNSAQLKSGAKMCSVNNRDTGYNDEGEGNVWFLDRHNVECNDNQFINSFKINRSGQNKFRYEYTCMSYSTGSPQCYERSTPLQDVGNGGDKAVDYLDRHNVECDNGYALQKFKFSRQGDKATYNYKCCKGNFLSCDNRETAADSQGDKHTAYLDRQAVDGEDNGAIAQFRLQANLPGNKLKYQFLSCKVRCG